jgi:hypothetical protein
MAVLWGLDLRAGVLLGGSGAGPLLLGTLVVGFALPWIELGLLSLQRLLVEAEELTPGFRVYLGRRDEGVYLTHEINKGEVLKIGQCEYLKPVKVEGVAESSPLPEDVSGVKVDGGIIDVLEACETKGVLLSVGTTLYTV